MRVWALEPFYGGSHRQFLDGLAAHSSHDFTLLTLPGRFWKWRMHGGALELADQAVRLAATEGLPDVFFASDMLDLSVFLGAVGRPGGDPRLSRVPAIVYFHENQLTYPLPPGVERDLGYGFKNATTALVAEKVLFNSEYHRREFLGAVADLLAAMPDAAPGRLVEEVTRKSAVLHVGCDLRALDRYRESGLRAAAEGRFGHPDAGPLLVWNQRWEYDKAPADLFAALAALRERGVPFRLAVAGSGATMPSDDFQRAQEALADRIVQWGRLDDYADYAGLLWASDVVVSTAIHEFFGVAVVEAVYCGCRPVLPRRLSYPELIPLEAHGDVLYGEGECVTALAAALAAPRAWSEDWQRTWAARFDWGSIKTRYDGVIGDIAGHRSGGPI